jgi:hypothetical protein
MAEQLSPHCIGTEELSSTACIMDATDNNMDHVSPFLCPCLLRVHKGPLHDDGICTAKQQHEERRGYHLSSLLGRPCQYIMTATAGNGLCSNYK